MKNIFKNKILILCFIFIVLIISIIPTCFAKTTYTFTSPDGISYSFELDFDDPMLPKNYAYFVSISPIYDNYLGEIYLYNTEESEMKVEETRPSGEDYGGNYFSLWLYRKSDGKETNNNDVNVAIYSKSLYKDGTTGEWSKLKRGYYGISFNDKQPRLYTLFIFTIV